MLKTFSTLEQIKKEAWFENNNSISPQIIWNFQARAYSRILSQLGKIYDIQTSIKNQFYIDSPGETILKSIETELATAYLLMSEYWISAYWDIYQTWKDKELRALSWLSEIAWWKNRLYFSNWTEFILFSTAPDLSWPLYTKPINQRIFNTTDRY